MGYMISHRLSVRVRFLQQYLQFVSYVETEIRYSKKILYEIVKNYNNENEFSYFLTDVCMNVESSISFDKSWIKSVHSLPKSYGLLSQDIEMLCNFGKELGNTDIDGQISFCNVNKSLISMMLENAKDEKNKKSKLYFMLGSSLGLCITIMLL